jgi:dTDP-4-dehydrorhamnose 3,5-epimerase
MPQITIEALQLPDVKLIRPPKFGDDRGFFAELYSQRSLAEHGIQDPFVQDNCSLSAEPGTIRGLHFQLPPETQAKLVRVERGAIFDAFVDLRRGSPTFGQAGWTVLRAEDWTQLYVPAGFAHGLCTLEPGTIVHYKVSAFYAPELDRGILWNDPALGIAWPDVAGKAVVSEKDRVQPRLAEIIDRLPF